jgi:hypothetical protein
MNERVPRSRINAPKRRGRKVSPDTLRQRLDAAEERARSATGLAKLQAVQDVRDLRTKLAAAGDGAATDVRKLEADFVRVARRFSEQRNISWGAFRHAGVPSPVLKRAGVRRTRG